jgi:hypothetical protein
MRYWYSPSPAPLALIISKVGGAPAASSAVARPGRMAAWGHTKEQMLHCVQFSLIHAGTCDAIARRSTTVVPGGTNPAAGGRAQQALAVAWGLQVTVAVVSVDALCVQCTHRHQ